MEGIALIQAAIAKIVQARSSLGTNINLTSSNILARQDVPDEEYLDPYLRNLLAEHERAKAEQLRADDELLEALEDGDDRAYDRLINPATGQPYTEPEKFDAIQGALDREISELSAIDPRTVAQERRLAELNNLSDSTDRSHVINALHYGGVDVLENKDLIDDLGNPEAADAFVNLFNSDSEIAQNTAEGILDGDLVIINMDENRIEGIITYDFDGDGVDDVINSADHPGIQFIEHPETGEIVPVPIGAAGFNVPGTDEIWISTEDANGNPLSQETIEATIVHEANHALNPLPANFENLPSGEQAVLLYESEYRAYWVDPEFADLTDDEKMIVIPNLILSDPTYAAIQQEILTDRDLFDEMLEINQNPPTGNLTNEN